MAFTTVNATPSVGEWNIVDAYATNISTSSELLADLTANQYLVKSIWIDMDGTDRWIKIFDDAAIVCGPIETRGHLWHVIYESPLLISGALNVQTESDKVIHITVCYRKRALT